MTNYYDILNVNINSTFHDLKKSYRNLSLKYHPDKNKNKSDNDRYILINEAYDVLSDVTKRNRNGQTKS